MKNTLLITLDFWPNRGGVANYYYNLVKNLPKENIFVLTSAKKENSNLKIYNQPLLYKLIWPHWLCALKTTIKLIKKHNIKINCGSKKCKTCLTCYTKKGETFINELLK